MKVIYVKTILEQIRDEQHKAEMHGREIEKIILTAKEAEKLKFDVGMGSGPFHPDSRFLGYGELPRHTKVRGVCVESEVK
jgi:hypothetical protein